MQQPLFGVGDHVIHLPTGIDYNVARRRFTIVQIISDQPTDIHYRVRCQLDAHEKVLHEDCLMAALRPPE